MPYANNQGVRIYFEVEGEGPPLVLAHPLTASLDSWKRDKYPDALRNDYRLILIDARGHGRSDKPHQVSDYDVKIMGRDALAVLDEIGVSKTHYFGYSLGSRVGFWLATHHAERFYSFILAGMTPYTYPEVMIKPLMDMVEGRRLQLTDPQAYLQRRQSQLRRPLSDQEKKSILESDPKAFISAITSFLQWPSQTDNELAAIPVPCLVYCGEIDEGGFHSGAKESANHIPQAKFVSFPGVESTIRHRQRVIWYFLTSRSFSPR
jgi:pimeloyl-ACP methyl ester carboxylesterase